MTHERSLIQRLSAFALTLALAVPLSVSAEMRTPYRTATSVSLSADALVRAMNRQRAAYGLEPLRLNSRLSQAANDRVGDMMRKRYFDHVSPDGLNPFTWVAKHGYRYSIVGENLAVGYPNAERVVAGWMSSPGHRANILQSRFDEIGIAYDDAAPIRGYRGPLVVALYGSR